MKNPVIHVGKGQLRVLGNIPSGQFIQYTGGDKAIVYDENWNKREILPIEKEKLNVCVLGDSISMHYGPFLKSFLPDRFNYTSKGDKNSELGDLNLGSDVNGGDSSLVLEYLKARIQRGFHPDLLLLNCGLHDVKTDPVSGARHVPIYKYESNLKEIVRVLKAAKIKTVWIRTTHADENVHNKLNNVFWRFAKDVEDYNAVADAITAEAGFPSIDLHGFTKSLGGNPFCDHIHFNEDVRRLQAAFIAGHIIFFF